MNKLFSYDKKKIVINDKVELVKGDGENDFTMWYFIVVSPLLLKYNNTTNIAN